jgi:hypothetical protein
MHHISSTDHGELRVHARVDAKLKAAAAAA